MRWPWRRQRPPPADDPARAREEAQQKLASTHMQSEEVREVSETLRGLRDRNRFAEMIIESMRVRKT